MDWRGRFTVALALAAVVVAFGVATLTGAAPRPEPQLLGQYASYKVADGLPPSLGPALVDATYRDVGDDNDPSNDVLYVVFDKSLNVGSVDGADFAFHASPGGLTVGGGGLTVAATTYGNVFALSGFTNEPSATDSVALSGQGVVTGSSSGGVSEDVSWIHIKRGPVIARAVFVSGYTTETVTDDTLRVFFTHELNASSLDLTNAKTDFDMAEFGTDAGVNPQASYTAGTMSVDIAFDDPGVTTEDHHFGQIKPGVSKIRLKGPGVIQGNFGAGDPANEDNQSTRWVRVWRMHGPRLLTVGYNDFGTADSSDDVMTLVFDRDIPSSVTLDGTDLNLSTAHADFNPSVSSLDGDHVVQFQDMRGSNVTAGGATVTPSGNFTDHQGNGALSVSVPVQPSPIMVLARYNDAGDSDPSNDQLEVIFDVGMVGSLADTADFNYYGFVSDNLLITDNADNDSLLVFTGFTGTNTWRPGDRIQIRANSDMMGYQNGAAFAPADNYVARSFHPVRDASAPRTLLFAQNDYYTRRDAQDSGDPDTAYVGLNELGVDDAAYYLFYTRKTNPVDLLYAQSHFNNAVFITNPNPGPDVPFGGPTNLDQSVITTYNLTSGSGIYSDGQIMQDHDVVRFGVLAADLEGNVAFFTPSNLFFGGLVVGPVPCPPDFITDEDDDIIHVWGDGTDHFVGSDPNSLLSSGTVDSVRVYAAPGFPTGTLLGAAAVAGDGSWGPVNIGNYTGDYIYLISVDDFGSICAPPGTQIINDVYAPELTAAIDPLQSLFAARCYSAGDTLRILANADDPVAGGGTGLNDLLRVSADLTGFVTTAGADDLVFTSLGANQVDDDNDWSDVSVQSAFNANGTMDFPEPYVDENGNGQWDPGETFVDIVGTGYTANVYDFGDQNLDSNDPDEHGRYLAQYPINEADMVADPNGITNFAVLEDVPAILTVADNAASSQADLDAITEGAATNLDLSSTVASFSMEQSAVDNTTFKATEDSQAPTVSEISFLERQLSWINPTGNPADNIIEPGDHVYKLASGDVNPFFNLADSTLSDDDVIFVALQIDPTPNSDDNGDFTWLNFDPVGDANGDGAPGIADYDDDNDVATGLLTSNGVDDDEDGVIDNPEEGIDLHDPEVVDAMQDDATVDAAAGTPDGTHRLNDHIDNDGDAFFRVNPISGNFVWFNIDESDTNGVDDDGNGVVDDAGEVETYDPVADDDEDGMTDGSAVGVTVVAGQYLPDPTYAGMVYVPAFSDGDAIAKYPGTPAANKPDGFGTYPDALTANDGVPGKRDVLSMVNAGADNFGMPWMALGAPNVISAQGQVNPVPGGAPWVNVSKMSTSFAFDYRAQNGRNLNMKVIKSLYGLNDGDTYRLRAVAYDACYQGNANWAVPLKFSIDSEAPEVSIPPAPFDDVVDNDPATDGLQICDVQLTDWDGFGGPDPKVYTLEADLVTGNINDIAQVEFQIWDPAANGGLGAWMPVDGTYNAVTPAPPAVDTSPPFTLQWAYTGAPLNNNPPANRDTLYFRTIATDQFGNVEAQALCDSLYTTPAATDTCYELQAILTDCTPPWSCLCQIGSDYDPSDGAFVPLESAVDISACFSDNDNDPTTNDVVRLEFQYRPVGTQDWMMIPGLTGVPVDTTGDGVPDVLVDPTGINHPIIQPDPNVDSLVATVTWDTHGFAAGSYDLRAIAYDIEGNENSNMTCTATATLDNVALRAYIQPCVKVATAMDSLFANVYIHDVAVSKVEFQYYADLNANGIPDDPGGNPNDWITIDTQGDVSGERKGDVILRAGTGHERDVMNGTYHALAPTWIRFYDVDGDGYNPVDPVVFDANNDHLWNSGDQTVIGTSYTIPTGATLTDFAADEYYVDIAGDASLTADDWILKNNPLNPSPDNQIDLWTALWDQSGLNGSYIVRAVATDAFGNVDDDVLEPRDDTPDTDTNIWYEQCTVDSNAPVFCVTQYIPADGSAAVDIPFGPDCPWVAPQDSLTLIATPKPGTESADVDSVRFFYFRNGMDADWVYLGTDMVPVDGWSMVFPYGSLVFPTDTETNFRAVAYDANGNYNTDPDACKACLVLGENKGPETDIVMIVTAEGDTLDANTVLRGSQDPYCMDPTTLYMLVTAEDNQNIDRVELWYRKAAGTTPSDTTSWAMIPGQVDDSYPYEFNWDISALTDGVYQFFPRGYDENGNMTPVFGNPYEFSLSRRTAMVVAAEKNGIAVTSLTPGEEVVIKGELDDPSDYAGVSVLFTYAERIEGEMLEVSATYPYTATTAANIWSSGATGMHGSETVLVNGTPATWHNLADFLALGTPTKMDYTITGPNALRFGDMMAADDTVTINYDITDCTPINTGDDEPPYSVAWDADSPDGLVPQPSNPLTTHYDLMASAVRSFGGSWQSCPEACVSEGFALPLNDTEAPEFAIAGLDYRNPNWPANPLCSNCNEDWPQGQDPEIGSCKSRLAGTEHQFFVTTDDDVVSVTMAVDGNPPVSFTHYTAADSVITIPITFYLDNLAAHALNQFEYQAVNPDSVENVTIDVPGISVMNAEMTDNGDGTYTYMATLPLGAAYDYAFHVDFVGDDQWNGDDLSLQFTDPELMVARGTITVPPDFWFYQTSDPATLFGVNTLDQVVITATDADGNSSTNLSSGAFGGGALGQIWVTYDPTPPVVKKLFVTTPKVAPGGEVQVMALITDGVPANSDVVGNGVAISYQASMDVTDTRWREFSWTEADDNLYDYWEHSDTLPDWMNPATDGIDNDRDGLTDEPDECTFTYKIRAVVYDDCYLNAAYSYGHPRAQVPPVYGEITVDGCIPQACLTTPTDGDVFTIGDTVDLVAASADTDIAYVVFEYSTDSGNTWNTIDCTPLNDDDDPWVSNGENGQWTCSWDTGFLAQFLSGDFYVSLRARAVDKVGNDQGDDPELNCHVNVIMNDTAGPTAVITKFFADCFPQDPDQGGNFKRPFDPTLALSHDITVYGRAAGWNGLDVANVVVEVSSDQQNWTVLGIPDEIGQNPRWAEWSVVWPTDDYAEGTWYLRVYAIDADGNVQGDTDGDGKPDTLPVVKVTIDHTAPDFQLVRVGPEGVGSNALEAGDLIRADLLDQETGICPALSPQITFMAAATDPPGEVEAINGMTLQFLDDVTDPENPTWHDLSPSLGMFTYRDAAGNPTETDPDGHWVLTVSSVQALANAMENAVQGGALPAKEYRFRVLATDYACNSNVASEGILLRLDHFTPEVRYIYAGSTEFEAGSGAGGNAETRVHVAGGDTVPLAARINDWRGDLYPDDGGPGRHRINHETSGIFAVQFAYRPEGGDWTVIGLGTLDDGGTPDDPDDDLWRIDWATPENLPGGTDVLYDIRVLVRDNAGNSNCPSGDWAEGMVAVQDITPPVDSKLIAVAGFDGDACATYPRTALDYLGGILPKGVKRGASQGPGSWADLGIDDNVLAQDLSGTNPLGTVARDVFLFASTPQGDLSMEGGRVFFEARRMDASKPNSAGPWMALGEGECIANCPEDGFGFDWASGVQGAAGTHLGPIWALAWNTLAQDPDGNYIWYDPNADGNDVQIRVRSVDVWGNEETVVDDAIYRLVVDNTAPVLAVSARDPETGDPVTQVERNSADGVLLMASGGGSPFTNDDLTVTFFYKLATDLNDPASWVQLPGTAGIAPTNDNPDLNRPYSFQWNTNGYRDGNGEPLIPNEDYDICVQAQDLVCNTTNVVDHFTAGGYAAVKFVDTIAPVATIVRLERDYSGAECEPGDTVIDLPQDEHVNGLESVTARILDGSTDTQDVKFYYRRAGTTSWTLADADVTLKDLDGVHGWWMENWSTAPLAEGNWEMIAVATDDAGNSDMSKAPVMRFVIDRTGPELAGVNPVDGQIIVPENLGPVVCDPTQRVADLIAVLSDDYLASNGNDVIYHDSGDNCLEWEWKLSRDEDIDDNWSGFGSSTLYDAQTGRFSSTVDLLGINRFRHKAFLVDWRLVATDEAGNSTKSIVAERTVVDNADPTVEVTNFRMDGDETTIDPIDNGQITDVSAGDKIWIYATASDDEVDLPDEVDTKVSEVQFYVAPSTGGGSSPGVEGAANGHDWRLIGTAGYDEAKGLWGVLWNTTGLAEGNYDVMARATDEAANCAASPYVRVTVANNALPLAQVSGFSPHLKSVITKNTLDRIYGLTFGEKDAATVFVQYKAHDATDWTTIGTAVKTDETLVREPGSDYSPWLIPQDLWYAQLVSSNWNEGDLVDLRVVATDELPAKPGDGGLAMKSRITGQGGIEPADGDPGIFSGLYDLDNTPVLTVKVQKEADGSTVLVPNDDLGYLGKPNVILSGPSNLTGRVEVSTGDTEINPFMVLVGQDDDGNVDEYIPRMISKVDDDLMWTGGIKGLNSILPSVNPSKGAVITVYASAHKKRASSEDPAPKTEMTSTDLYFYQVTPNLGTRGVAGLDGDGANAADGYPADKFAMKIPAGAFTTHYGLLLQETDMPEMTTNQDRYLETVGMAYKSVLLNRDFTVMSPSIVRGYRATGWIRYSDDDLITENPNTAERDTVKATTLKVYRWTGNSWTTSGITIVGVDTGAKVVQFTTDEMSPAVWTLAGVDPHAPVEFSMTPNWNGYTDQDPILRGIARSPSGFEDFRLYIDNQLAYSSVNNYYRYPDSWFTTKVVSNDGLELAWQYNHGCANEDALKDGQHTVQLTFEDNNGNTIGADTEYPFLVDSTAPYIEFHAGFVGDPTLPSAPAYTKLDDNILTVRMYDGGSGILFKEDRIDDISIWDSDDDCQWDNIDDLCERYGEQLNNQFGLDICDDDEALFGDDGFKFDVWVVNDSGGDDHGSPDDLETRTLIYTGTADAIAPYLKPQLSDYTPGDTLTVPLAILTGGKLIEDGSVLEITLYSHKIMVWPQDLGLDELLPDEVLAMFQDAGLQLSFGWDADKEVPMYYSYVTGPMDRVGNAGSRFVEHRFIVDTTAPEVTPTSPGVSCDGTVVDPVEQSDHYIFTASFQDKGAGVDPATVTAKVIAPDGTTAETQDMDVSSDGLNFTVTNQGHRLMYGTYSVMISGADKVGNKFSKVCTFTVGTSVVQVKAAKVIPNPFNPLVGNATISFDLTKPADVEVTAYDWAGDYVATIFKGAKGVGPVNIEWGGQTEDGRALANGVYLIHIVVNDGSRQEPRVLKLAIWNER